MKRLLLTSLALLSVLAFGSAVIGPSGGSGASASNKWDKEGDAGTVDTVNFIGTLDAQDLVFKSNNVEQFRLLEGDGVQVTGNLHLLESGGPSTISLSAPALAANYALSLPAALPGSTLPLLTTSAGVQSFGQINLTSMVTGILPSANGGVPQALDTSDSPSFAAITISGTPTNATDAATKGYVDGVAQGAKVKPNIKAATTVAGTLASSFENGDTVDGYTLQTGDRILIKDQASPSENGIYVVAASGAPTRATDSDTWDELVAAYAFIENGTVNQYSGWRSTTAAGGTLGVNDIPFALFSQVGTYTADGNGLELSGSQFELELDGTTLSKSATGLKVETTNLANFVGDSGSGGTKGLVPAPAAGDAALNKFLNSDGTWQEAPGAGVLSVERFSGDGVDTTFVLTQTPEDEDNTQIYISGVYQQKNTYSLSGQTITFSEAPPIGTDNIEVVVQSPASTYVVGAGSVDSSSILDNEVSNADLRQSAGLSVIGRSANSTGNVADITAVTDGHVLRLNGTTLGFGQVQTAGIADDAITADKIADGAIGASQLAASNYSISSSSGSYALSNPGTTSYSDVTNLSVSITTNGRPVEIFMVSQSGTSDSYVTWNRPAGGTAARFKFLRGSTSLFVNEFYFDSSRDYLPCSSFRAFDTPSAGTYTYKVQAATAVTTGASIEVVNCKLVAREL